MPTRATKSTHGSSDLEKKIKEPAAIIATSSKGAQITPEQILAFKSRPDRAIASRRKDQRNAPAIREALKATKVKLALQAKRQSDAEKIEKRAQLYAELSKTALSQDQIAGLARTSDLRSKSAPAPRVRDETPTMPAPTTSAPAEKTVVSSKKRKLDAKNISSKLSLKTARIMERAWSGSESDGAEEEEASPSPRAEVPATAAQQAPVSSTMMSVDASAAVNPFQKERVKKPKPQPTSSQVEEEEAADVVNGPVHFTDKVLPEATARIVVRPDRTEEMQQARSSLPVCGLEQEIMETIQAYPIVVLCGETGSGKTTQVPQMLLEAGFGCGASPSTPGMIVISQPRRVAAVSMAKRVAHELNAEDETFSGDRFGTDAASLRGCVGHQVRHDSHTVNEKTTRIKFVTDGVLLREARDDVLLTRYSCVILDEAHERGINSDLLLGLLSRVVPLRNQLAKEQPGVIFPLKLIIMSATLAVEDLVGKKRLFPSGPPPVIQVESRQFPVTPHFVKRTELVNYLQATFKKVCSVHRKLPHGGVLVFLTGQQEIEWMCDALEQEFNRTKQNRKLAPTAEPNAVEASSSLAVLGEEVEEGEDEEELQGMMSEVRDALKQSEREGLEGASDEEDDDDVSSVEEEPAAAKSADAPKEEVEDSGPKRVHVVPLYSRLSADLQQRAFAPPPENARLIVVATNVAETSITIPNIRYVVDCGREKRREHDQLSGTSCFRVGWISQASANQRAGRAGRTQAGHCYRLYSPAVFQHEMPETTVPELEQLPIDDLVLYMKTMGIASVVDFPFPSPVSVEAVRTSETRLEKLGALSYAPESQQYNATNLGRCMSRFPVSARIAKSIVVAVLDDRFKAILSHVALTAACLSLTWPFELHSSERKRAARAAFRGDGTSDALSLLRAAGAFEYAVNTQTEDQICESLGLHKKTMKEAHLLGRQLETLVRRLSREIRGGADEAKRAPRAPLQPLPAACEVLLKQCVATGLLDRVARRLSAEQARGVVRVFPPKRPSEWPYESCDPSLEGKLVFIDAKSFVSPDLFDSSVDAVATLPEYLAYTSVSSEGRMEGLTVLQPEWLCFLARGTSQLGLGKPCETPEPQYDASMDLVTCTYRPVFGQRAWSLPGAKGACPDPYAHFARALLEGKLIGPGNKPTRFALESELTGPPAHVVRVPHKRSVVALVVALKHAKVGSAEALKSAVEKSPDFLYRELKAHWIQPGVELGLEAWQKFVRSLRVPSKAQALRELLLTT